MFSMKRGGVLVTCGSTTGVSTEINLFQLYQRQLRLFGSFGCNLRNLATVLDKMAKGVARPVIDTVIGLADIDIALTRLESRDVFGKIIVTL
jgi:alcohol dehydrogenase